MSRDDNRRPYIRMIGLSEATGMLRAQLEAALRRAGRVWNIVGIMSQNPRAMKASMDFYGAIKNDGLVKSRFQTAL